MGSGQFSLPANEIITQLRKNYDRTQKQVVAEINEALFQNLILFASGGLDIFYESFLDSERFILLQKEVEKQEVLYNVLRRYDLI